MAYFITSSATSSYEQISIDVTGSVVSSSISIENNPINLDFVTILQKGSARVPNISKPLYKDSLSFLYNGLSVNWLYNDTASRDSDFDLIKTLSTAGGSDSHHHTPGGKNGSIQYNGGGFFDGANEFLFLDGTNTLVVTGSIVLGPGAGGPGGIVDFTEASAISGSIFSGSFIGDGSGLTGISTDPFPYTGSAEITGSLTISGSLSLWDGLYDSSNNTGSVGNILSSTSTGTLWISSSGLSSDSAEHIQIECKNTSGGTLSKGIPVYITGTVGATTVVEIAPASSSNSSTMPALGLLKQDLNNNGTGYVVVNGILDSVATDPINGDTPDEGDVLYVHANGGLTIHKPSGSNLIQNVGKVGKVSGGSAGSIIVSSIMRSNDVPNLLHNNIFYGSGSDQTYQTHLSGALDSTVINNITASGDISASGKIYSTNLRLLDDNGGIMVQLDSDSGDSIIRFADNGTQKWDIGRDNSNQNFVFSNDSGLDTNDLITFTPSGDDRVIINGAISASNYVSASSFIGDGSQLTGITANAFPFTGSAGISGSLIINNLSEDPVLTLQTTSGSSNAGPVALFQRFSPTVDDGDYLGQLKFQGYNDASASKTYAKISSKTSNVTATDEDGVIEFMVRADGSEEIPLRINKNGLYVNTNNGIVFEGVAADTAETTLQVIDPKTDVTVNIPDASGTLLLDDGDGSDLYNLQRPVSLSVSSDITASTANSGYFFEVGDVTCSIQANATVACPIGSEFEFFQTSSGNFIFVTGSGVTLRSKDGDIKINGQYAGASLKKIRLDEWVLVGDLIT